MIQEFNQLLRQILEWPFWEQFRLVQGSPPSSESIFGLAEFLASLALFLVVMTTSDFRYSYRLSLTKTDLRKAGFWVGLSIGALILATDFWYQNGLPVPKLISNSNNVKALLGFVFLTLVFWVIAVAVIRPPVFTKRNAQQFFDVNYYLIHQGNPDRLQVLAEELRRSMRTIIALAANMPNPSKKGGRGDPAQEVARRFLLLIGDGRFC